VQGVAVQQAAAHPRAQTGLHPPGPEPRAGGASARESLKEPGQAGGAQGFRLPERTTSVHGVPSRAPVRAQAVPAGQAAALWPGPGEVASAAETQAVETRTAETDAVVTGTAETEAGPARAAEMEVPRPKVVETGARAPFRARAPGTPVPDPIRSQAPPLIRQRARDQTLRPEKTRAAQASLPAQNRRVCAWDAVRVPHLPGQQGRTEEDLRRAAPCRADPL